MPGSEFTHDDILLSLMGNTQNVAVLQKCVGMERQETYWTCITCVYVYKATNLLAVLNVP